MDVREWALIIFTLLSQMAVGAFLVLGIVHFFAARRARPEEVSRLTDRALLAIGPLLALGFLASLFHLGDPLQAYRAVSNFDESWLSREILFGSLFFVIGGLFALMQWRKIGSFAIRNVLAWIAAILGLAMVYSMARIYMLPAAPAWDTLATPISFLTTTALLGLLALGSAFVVNYSYAKREDPDCAEVQCELLRANLRWFALAALLLLGVHLVTIPVYLAALASGPPASAESARLLVDDFGVLLGLRIALVFLGAGVLAFFLYQTASSPGRERAMGYLAYGAFALVFVAEVMGRFLFYGSHVGLGI